MEWWMIMLAVWFVFSGIGGRRSCGRRPRHERRFERAEIPSSTAAKPIPRRPTAEAVEAELRRRYVSGELTVEQYESELDRFYRSSAGARR
jgi:hypothetical protein